MDRRELAFLTAGELGQLVRRRALSSEEVVRASLDRIEALDPRLNAFITVCGPAALRAARRADRELARGRARGPLHGVPFAVKDSLWTRGIRTTNGSRLFAEFVPARDATVVARMRRAGAILLGKLNMMEIGFGPTLHPPFGVPRNPWDLARTPGGSSSGSAAAAAAGLCPVTLGADAGGSIRLPAAFCGVVGLKPTWGRLSRHGLMGICGRFECPGPLGATVADCALVLQAIAGHDPRDPETSRKPAGDYARALQEGVQGVRIGVVQESMRSGLLHPQVRDLVDQALGLLARLGATIEPVAIPLIDCAAAVYLAIAEPEAAARYRPYLVSRGQDLDVLPRRRLLAASLIPASLTARALRLRERLRGQVDEALRAVDVLASPTAPGVASPLPSGAGMQSEAEAWRTLGVGRGLFTNPFSITGHPALSVPCGFTAEDLPAGLQLIGRAWREEDILRVAAAYQAATGWHRRRPPVEHVGMEGPWPSRPGRRRGAGPSGARAAECP